jgi:hypothetical protein
MRDRADEGLLAGHRRRVTAVVVAAAAALAIVATPVGGAAARAPDESRSAGRDTGSLVVGRIDWSFDDFGASDPGPGLLPLVAGTKADVELRWTAPVGVRDGRLQVLLPNVFRVNDVRPVRQLAGYAGGSQPNGGAFTVRPSATFAQGYRPAGHCRPVPGTRASQSATRTDRGWRLTVSGVTCAPGQVLRLRVYGVHVPEEPGTVRVPWRLTGASLVRAPAGDVTVARAVGAARVRVVAASTSRLEVTAPPTYQLVRDYEDGLPARSVSATPIDATVRVLRADGSLDTDWTGWLTVAPDLRPRAYTFPCDSFGQAVRVRKSDDGVVTVSGIELIRDVDGYVNAWAMDHSLKPGSSALVVALPPPDGLPYAPSTICPISYH